MFKIKMDIANQFESMRTHIANHYESIKTDNDDISNIELSKTYTCVFIEKVENDKHIMFVIKNKDNSMFVFSVNTSNNGLNFKIINPDNDSADYYSEFMDVVIEIAKPHINNIQYETPYSFDMIPDFELVPNQGAVIVYTIIILIVIFGSIVMHEKINN